MTVESLVEEVIYSVFFSGGFITVTFFDESAYCA